MTKTIPHLLAIDPGLMNGWALFHDLVFMEMGQISLNDLPAFLENGDEPSLVVVEDYKLFKHLALQQSGSHIEAAKAIGVIESYCNRHGVKMVLQQAGILPIAEKWTNTKRPKNHAKGHQVCAYLHGEYFLIKNGYKEVEF
jgi:hypothetical protein